MNCVGPNKLLQDLFVCRGRLPFTLNLLSPEYRMHSYFECIFASAEILVKIQHSNNPVLSTRTTVGYFYYSNICTLYDMNIQVDHTIKNIYLQLVHYEQSHYCTSIFHQGLP